MSDDGSNSTVNASGIHPESVPTGDLPPSAKSPARASGPDGETLPAQVGGFKIVKRLGRGGMGVVYLGVKDEGATQRRVAIKLVRPGLGEEDAGSKSGGVVKRFELERQVLQALNHSNIARVFDAGRHTDGRPFFVMEYVDGEPIDEYCDRMELNVEQRVRLFQKVCGAVHYAHQNLVIHRDIKPSNILVDAKGEPKLMDFGIAKLTNPDMVAGAMATTADLGPMTPEYASPEQVLGKPIGTTADVYALGVLLYELLTGRRPYRLKSRAVAEMIRVICEEEPEKPSTAVTQEFVTENENGTTRTVTADALARPREGAATRLKRKLAGDLDNIVLMAMRKSPQRRYASAEALSEDIGRYLGGLPVKARSETWLYVATKFASRNRFGVGAAALVLMSMIGGGAAAGVFWQREKRARVAEQVAREREAKAREATVGLAKEYVRGMARMIAPQEGASPALLSIADATLKTIESRREQFGDEPESLSLIASAYELGARVKAGVRSGGVVDAAEAVRLAEQAEQMRRASYERTGKSADAAAALAVALVYKSDALRAAGKPAEAKAASDEAGSLADALGAKALESPATARLVATTLLLRGDDADAKGMAKEAGEFFARSLEVRRQNFARFADAGFQRDITVGLDRVGLWLVDQGRPDEGLAHLREALEIREQLMGSEKTARSRRDWALAVSAIARSTAHLGRKPDDSLEEQCRRAVRITGELLDGEKPASRAFAEHAGAIGDLGRVLALTGRGKEAIDAITSAVAEAERFHRAAPQPRSTHLLCELLLWLGQAQAAEGSTVGAVWAYERALVTLGAPRDDEDPSFAPLRERIEAANSAVK